MEDIGLRLKKTRESRGISQRQLAKRSGVSNAMICLIEKGKSSPSLGLLKTILESMPISVSEFFSFEIETPSKVFYRHDELTDIGSGAIAYRQVGNNLSAGSLQIMHERYRPGSDTGRTLLHHEGEEGGIIISGHLEVTVGEQTQILGPGDAYLFHSQTPHRFRNIGNEDCILVTSCTPPSF